MLILKCFWNHYPYNPLTITLCRSVRSQIIGRAFCSQASCSVLTHRNEMKDTVRTAKHLIKGSGQRLLWALCFSRRNFRRAWGGENCSKLELPWSRGILETEFVAAITQEQEEWSGAEGAVGKEVVIRWESSNHSKGERLTIISQLWYCLEWPSVCVA